MKCPKIELHFPESFHDLWELSAKYEPGTVAITSGGTDLIPRLKNRLLMPAAVVGLSRIKELQKLSFDIEKGLALGACVRLVDIVRHPDICKHYPDLASAASQVASAQVRNMGTLGGTLCQETRCAYYNRAEGPANPLAPCFKRGGDVCHAAKGSKLCYAAYQGDVAPVLLARGAKVELRAPTGERWLSVKQLFSGDGMRPLALQTSEVITTLRLPAPSPNTVGAYRKFRLRDGIDFPLAGVAVTAIRKGEGLMGIRVVLTGVGQSPIEVDLESLAVGGEGSEFFGKVAAKARAAAHPVANLESSPAHRRRMVEVMTNEMLVEMVNS